MTPWSTVNTRSSVRYHILEREPYACVRAGSLSCPPHSLLCSLTCIPHSFEFITIMLFSQWLLPLTFVSQVAHALPFFTNGTIPANLTTTCASALLTDVTQCPPSASRFMNGYYYPPSILEKACTSTCSTALEQYEQKVKSACAGQTWAGYDDENDTPLDIIPNVMRFNRDLACIQDSGRWCNVVAAAAAMQADPGRKSHIHGDAQELTKSRESNWLGQHATNWCGVFGTLRLMLHQKSPKAGWLALLLWTSTAVQLHI